MPPCLPSRQGVPSVLLGLVAPAVLTDRPEQARWLSPAERLVLRQALDAGAAGGGGAGGGRRGGGAGSAVEAAPLVATLRATLGLSSALTLTLTLALALTLTLTLTLALALTWPVASCAQRACSGERTRAGEVASSSSSATITWLGLGLSLGLGLV